MGLKYPSSLFLTVMFRGCPNALSNGYDTLCFASVGLVVISLQHRMVLQWTMATCWPTLYTISILQVTFLLVCKIVAHYGSENCTFVDHEGLNEQLTSTSLTPHRYDFRQGIIRRDGSFCVITQDPASYCDAAHLIPRCKGDEVMSIVSLCDPLMTFYSSTSGMLSEIVLTFITLHLQFLGLTMLRMGCY
jgi:hypothetical protein